MTNVSDKDLEEWYPISRKDFRTWLESKEENVVVGQSIYYGNDPISTSLNEKESGFEIVIIDTEESSTRLNDGMTISNPRWVNRFIEKIDENTLGDEHSNLTAKQVLELLTEVEGEQEKTIDTERFLEIENAKRMFLTDSYSMSVGELLSLHEDDQLTLSDNNIYSSVTQQNEFIESIFLDLPSQPLFVRQDSSGKWKVISGSWMLGAIINFLEDNEKNRLVLRATDLLPSLYSLTWDDLSNREKFQFKRYKFKVHILAENTEDKFWKDKVSSIFRRYSSYGY